MKAKQTNETIMMLRYRINRYRSMGNGSKCQELISEMKKLEGNNGARA